MSSGEKPTYHENLQARLTVKRLVVDHISHQATRRIVHLSPVDTVPATQNGSPHPILAQAFLPRAGALLRMGWHTRSEVILFTIALSLYLCTRLIGLTHYPIYFLGDEAIHSVYAAELIRQGGEIEGTFLPTYFKNGPKYNLSLSVYVQILPTLLFGKSVAVTRATSVLFTLIPAIVVGLIIRDFLKLPYGWSATLLLSLVPVWFLHSRTALETTLAVSLFSGFLYYYLRYRLDDPKYLFAALTFGALTFYSYSPAQLVIVAFAGGLLLIDFRYHLKNWKITFRGLGFLFILILPYLRFRLQVNAPIEAHLRDLGSYWLAPIPLSEKLEKFISLYFYGLSPGYWYITNSQDLARHQMGRYGNIMGITLPFALVGILVACKSILMTSAVPQSLKALLRLNVDLVQPETEQIRNRMVYRTLLLALLITPLPGTLAQVGNTRILTFVIPITILSAVGLIAVLGWLETHGGWFLSKVQSGFAPGMFSVLGLGLIFFTSDALRNGPFWYQDYGFGGMQYGAQQVFDQIKSYREISPSIHIILTPNWANNSDFLSFFFLDNPSSIEMASIHSFLIEEKSFPANHLVILTPQEYEQAQQSGKFSKIDLINTIAYPNGTPGYYFLHLSYVENISEILDEEREARHALAEGTMMLDGAPTQLRYSQLDMGEIEQVFDGSDQTVIRTLEANPAIIELTFSELRPIQEVAMIIGADKTQISFWITTDPNQPPIEISQIVDGREPPHEKVINFGETYDVQALRIEVFLVEHGEPEHVHIWDIWLR